MKIATFNINGVKARLPVLLDWLQNSAPDVAVLQEIKSTDDAFPRMEIEALALEDEASRMLRRHRVIGFNTYGEQHHGMHINQTFTGVVIGLRRSVADGTGGEDVA